MKQPIVKSIAHRQKWQFDARYIIIFAVLSFFFCSRPELDEQTVSIVGKERITIDDLILKYELTPNWAPNKKGAERLKAHLNLLIEEQLFAREGRRRGYAKDAKVRRIVNWVRDDELRKALYRTEVEAKVHVSEEELLQAFHQENTQLDVRHLFARTEEQAVQMQQALDDGMRWEDLARLTFMDSTLAFTGGRLGWLGVGDMEPELEAAAYKLALNEISAPLRTRFGYHLLQVTNVRKNIMLSAADYQQQKPKLERTLRTRKEKELADRYVGEFMKTQNVVLRNDSFDLIVAHIRDDVMDKRTPAQLNLPALRDGELSEINASLSDYAEKTFITFAGGEWTIGDFLAKLKALPVTRRPKMKSPQQFRRDIGIMIRDDFLAAEARKQHLEEDPIVQKEVRRTEDQYVFGRFWQDIQDTITISTEDAMAFYQEHSDRYWVPEQVRVREILLSSSDEVQYVLHQLQQDVPFEALALELSLRRGTVNDGGDLGWLTSAQMGNIGATAFRLKKNQIAGPVEVDGGFSIIQNLGRRPAHVLAFEEALPLVERQLQKERSQTIYHAWVSRLAMETRISVNDTLITRLGNQLEKEGWVPMPGVRPVY